MTSQQHPPEKQRQAGEWTAAIERQIKTLDEVLASALRLPPFTFGSLMVSPPTPRFDPGPLGTAAPSPQWEDFAPARPRRPGRLFRRARYNRQIAAARTRFETAQAGHREQEKRRREGLAAAKAQHDKEVTEERARAARRNAYVSARQSAFGNADADAVEWFVGCLLNASGYPDVFPREHQVAYRPQNRDVVVEFELPPRRVVPSVRAFRYVRTRDVIEPMPRPETEIKQRYTRLICSIALRTVHEIFTATPADVVAAVAFNGRASTVDPATGKAVRPHLLSLIIDRSVFDELVLAEVEPTACVTHLNPVVSPDPSGPEAMQPIVGLDSRPDLLKVSRAEFEHLLRQLFAAMGAESWTTVPSPHGTVPSARGGVSGVLTSKKLFFGGACLLQAECTDSEVGLDSVNALTEAMSSHNVTAGLLLTTSWFSRACAQSARRNRITLIDGAELRQLINEHLNRDVILGTRRHDGLKIFVSGVAFGLLDNVDQRAQAIQVAVRVLQQRSPVIRVEVAGHLVAPVLRCPIPGVGQQAEPMFAILNSGRHVTAGHGGRPPGARSSPSGEPRSGAGQSPACYGTGWRCRGTKRLPHRSAAASGRPAPDAAAPRRRHGHKTCSQPGCPADSRRVQPGGGQAPNASGRPSRRATRGPPRSPRPRDRLPPARRGGTR
jgi:restriction system protein